MKRLFACLLLASSLHAATYYIAASGGSDSNNGSTGSRWATFAHAWSVMQAGDTLIVGDGTYTGQRIAPTITGTAQAHLTIQAEHDGAAVIDGGGTIDGPLTFGGEFVSYAQIDYIDVSGLVIANCGETWGATYELGACVYMHGNHNSVRRVSAYNAHADANSSVFWIMGSDNLVEDCVAGGMGRKMFLAFGTATRNIFRRSFAAWQQWNGAGVYNSAVYPWGETFDLYGTDNNIIENSIAYGMAVGPASGFEVMHQGVGQAAEGNALLGTMAVRMGKKWNGDDMTWTCPDPYRDPPRNCAILANNNRQAYPLRGTGVDANLYQDVFAWGNAGAAVIATAAGTTNQLIRATFINNGLGSGETGAEYTTGSLDHFNTFTDSYIEGDSNYQGTGARLVYRYESTFDGNTVVPTLTSTPLWPWPMESRIASEFNTYLLPTWGSVNPELEDFSVTTTMQGIFDTLGAQNPNPPRSSMSGGKITGGRIQ